MSKRKLLLADDSITIQKVVNLTFADEGIEVIPVGDGDSAMRKFDEFMPDLVMADVNMPGLTGYEICRIIKQTEETRHIPVILLVGSFEPFDEEEAKNVGADDFLTKPFQSIRQLVNKVTDLLNQNERVAEESPVETRTQPPADTFADTLEFEKKDEETVTEFGDAGMDDEMIETSPANDFVSESEAADQAEATIDYAKTQPLNAEDLKGFNIVPIADDIENQEVFVEAENELPERVEAATFAEEAKKLEETPIYEDAVTEVEPENIAVSEPQIDYYLPVGEESQTEVSEAETPEPETLEAEETPASIAETESADFTETETIVEPEIEVVEETPEAEPSFVEESPAETEEEAENDLTEEGKTEETPVSESVEETQVSASENISRTKF